MNVIVAWLVAAMVAWQPVGRTPWQELRQETEAETLTRYAELASAIAEVAYAPENAPLFGGARGRGKTAALLASIAWFESALHNRVTTGAKSTGDAERSDHGRSWCAAQILIGQDGIVRGRGGHLERLIPEGWTGPELEADPRKCMTVAYRFLRLSVRSCTGSGEEPLGRYTGEGCDADEAPKAHHRLAWARRIVAPLRDAAVFALPPAPTPESDRDRYALR